MFNSKFKIQLAEINLRTFKNIEYRGKYVDVSSIKQQELKRYNKHLYNIFEQALVSSFIKDQRVKWLSI